MHLLSDRWPEEVIKKLHSIENKDIYLSDIIMIIFIYNNHKIYNYCHLIYMHMVW